MNPDRTRRIGEGQAGSRARSRLLPLLLVCGVVGLALYLGFSGPHLSDQEQIYGVLTDIQGAVRKGSVDGVFSHVSSHFRFGNVTRQQAQLQLMQVFRSYSSSAIEFRNPQLALNGDTATLVADTEVSGAPGQAAAAATSYKGKVTLELQREEGRRFFLFPTHTWKIVKVEASGSPENDMM